MQLPLLLLVAALAGTALADGDCECEWQPPQVGQGGYLSLYGLASAKVDANAIRLFQMSRKIQDLQEKIKKMAHCPAANTARSLKFRVAKVVESWYEYKGCYQDDTNRLMTGLKTKEHHVYQGTIHGCAKYCASKGFEYAGLQFHDECFCSHEKPAFKHYIADRMCSSSCTDNHNHNCGGPWALSVFKTKIAGCARDQFRCKGANKRCVSNLLVCDGENDCPDGSDENEKLCNNHMEAGTTWEGTMRWSSCMIRSDQKFRVTIISNRRSKAFQPRMKIVASVTSTWVENGENKEESFVASGMWVFANSRMIIYPRDDKGSRRGVICEGRGDGRSADCDIVQEGTLSVCASGRITKQ